MVVRKLFEIDEEKGWGRVARIRCIKEVPLPFIAFHSATRARSYTPSSRSTGPLRWQFENGAVIYELIRRKFVGRLDRCCVAFVSQRFIFIDWTSILCGRYFFSYLRDLSNPKERQRSIYIYICTRESIYSYNDISIENNIDVAKSSRKDKKSKKFRLVKLI